MSPRRAVFSSRLRVCYYVRHGYMARRDPDPGSFLPLTPAIAHVLLAVADQDRHGYAIMQEVERMTDGTVRMGPGTLYGTIKRMMAARLIEETEERPDPERDDVRRRITARRRSAAACSKKKPRAWRRSSQRRGQNECGRHDGMAPPRIRRAARPLSPGSPPRSRRRDAPVRP
jgi:DNA-binding PadR family transcriptional regulator